MTSMQKEKTIALTALGFSIVAYIVGVWLTGAFLCKSYGPNAFFVSLIFCAIAFLFIAIRAFRIRSIATVSGALFLAILSCVIWFSSIGLTISCSGV